MDNMNINVVLLFITPILLGFALISLSRWAKTKNSKFAESRRHNRRIDGWNALKKGEFLKSLQIYYTGTLPPFWEKVGRNGARFVIFAVSVFLLFVLYAFLTQYVRQ